MTRSRSHTHHPLKFRMLPRLPAEALADEHIHRDTAVPRQSFDRIAARQRIGFGHVGGYEHAVGLAAASLLSLRASVAICPSGPKLNGTGNAGAGCGAERAACLHVGTKNTQRIVYADRKDR